MVGHVIRVNHPMKNPIYAKKNGIIRRIPRETRECKCNCGAKFVVKITSGRRYINGHNNKGKTFPSKFPIETRICICGCGKTFKCKINSERKYISGHNRKNFIVTTKTRKKLSNAWKHRIVSKKTKKLLSCLSKKMWANPEIANKIMTSMEKSNAGRGKNGYYYSGKNKKKIFYQSSYELKTFQLLEINKKVKQYIRCPYILDYNYNNKKCKYKPDILVTFKNNSKQIIEIKSKWELKTIPNKFILQNKINSLKKFCKKQKISYALWTEHKLFEKN